MASGARCQVRGAHASRYRGVLGLEGQLSQQTPHGVNVVEAGKTLRGAPRAFDGGHQQRRGRTHWLIMFVLNANKPFASDATFE